MNFDVNSINVPQAPVEEGDPRADSGAFRRSLGHFATGVTIITAQAEGRLVGLTANSFSSVSLDPPLVSWSIARTAESYPAFRAASHFAVNVLTADQISIAGRFANSGGDKFDGIEWRPGGGGAPVIADVAATFECCCEASYEAGDHVILLGRVERFARFIRPGLLFAQGRYGQVVDHPGFASSHAPDSSNVAMPPDTMLTLLRKAYGRLSGAFQVHRVAAGVTVNQGRVLTHLEQNPGASIEAVTRNCFLGPLDAEEAAAALRARGDAVSGADGLLNITAQGRERLLALRMRVVAFEAEELKRANPADVEATRRVLASMANGPVTAGGEGRLRAANTT